MPFRQQTEGETLRRHAVAASVASRDTQVPSGDAGHSAGREEQTWKAVAESTEDIAVTSDEAPAAGRGGHAARVAPAGDEALLRFVVDSFPAAVCYLDAAERYRLANRHHADWFGVPAQETAGRYMPDVVGDDAYRALGPQVRAALRGEGATAEASFTCAAGRTRIARARFLPHWDEAQARVVGCVGVYTEVAPESGAAPGQERLLELAHAARLALIGEMAGMLTHELAQPLAAISNYSSATAVLLQQGRHDEVRDIAQKLGLHARRALAIVQGLRRFLRKQSGGRDAIEIRDLVQEALRLVQFEADARGVPVRFETAMSLPPVHADATLIEQVVLNLLRNALDAMHERPDRGASIVVTVGARNGQVEVTVQDRGRGLAPEAKARLFEPFFTTKEEGLGVGLAICRRIVESHGGRLWAEDNCDGPGTTFRFTLPAA